MQTTTNEATLYMKTPYPDCIKESKSINRVQGLLWLLIGAVLFGIYSREPEKESTLGLVQLTLITLCAVMAIFKFFFSSNKLIYSPTGSVVKKKSYSFNITLQPEILLCLEEGNITRLRALKNDDTGGLLVELLESQDHLFIAARLLKYETFSYTAKTDWITLKK